jgi:hypothetical protein
MQPGSHSLVRQTDLLPPHVCRQKRFATEDYMFGIVGASSRYCIKSFFPTRRQPNGPRVTPYSGEWKNLQAEKQGSGVSAGLSEIYLSKASQPHILPAFAISMLISSTNCRRYSGATYRLMHFVTSLAFRRLTPRSSTLLGSLSKCCSIIFLQLHISCRR